MTDDDNVVPLRASTADRAKPLIHRAIAIGLSSTAAYVFDEICYRYRISQASFGGERFAAFTREELGERLILSVFQVKRALKMLRDKGVLRTEQHKFANTTQTFAQPLMSVFEAQERQSKVQKRTAQGERNRSTQEDRNCATQGDRNRSTLLTTLSTTLSTTQERKLSALASLDRQSGPGAKASEVSSEEESKQGEAGPFLPQETLEETRAAECADINVTQPQEAFRMKVTDLAAHFAAGKPSPTIRRVGAVKPDGVSVLHSIFRDAMKGSGEFVASKPSGKDIGFLKAFLGVVPEGEAGLTLQFVLDHWYRFTSMLEAEYGAYKLPVKPAIWVVAKYAEQAVTFRHRELAFLATQKAAGEPKLVPAPIPTPIPPSETPEGLQALEAARAARIEAAVEAEIARMLAIGTTLFGPESAKARIDEQRDKDPVKFRQGILNRIGYIQ